MKVQSTTNGTVFEVQDSVARSLIRAGQATEYQEPKKTRRRESRSSESGGDES